LNRAIAELLPELNSKPFQKLPGSRQSMFESIDRPALKPLPAQAYQYAQWKKATVNVDYHIEVARHYYSVPHTLIRKRIDVRLTDTTVECFYKGSHALLNQIAIQFVYETKQIPFVLQARVAYWSRCLQLRLKLLLEFEMT